MRETAAARPPATAPEPSPPWAQPGITSIADASAFLEALRDRDTLVLASADGDVGYPLSILAHRRRGHGATASANVVAATPPRADLLEYHRALGLGPERLYCPASPSSSVRLARLVLDDAALLDRIRADRSLKRMLFAFKDRDAELLAARLDLVPVCCAPSAAAYEAANDKLDFARAGTVYGFATLPGEPARDERELGDAFERLDALYGEGCVVRLRRGAGGHRVRHARSLAAARRAWRRLRSHGDVLVMPYLPPSLVERSVAAHGIVTPAGFAPIAFTDQLLRGFHFRGGLLAPDWRGEEIAAITSGLARIARWLGDLGYVGAPAGFDGFLVRRGRRLDFVALDPNVRMTATMGPWAVVAVLSELAGRSFLWQLESHRVAGNAITLRRLRRRLGADLVDPARLEAGGILPSSLATLGRGALGVSRIAAILLARDHEHLLHLRRQVARLGVFVR